MLVNGHNINSLAEFSRMIIDHIITMMGSTSKHVRTCQKLSQLRVTETQNTHQQCCLATIMISNVVCGKQFGHYMQNVFQ